MKNLVLLSVMSLIGVFAVACDGDDDDDGAAGGNFDVNGDGTLDSCEEYAKFYVDGMVEACSDRSDCCACDCMINGSSSIEGCDCDAGGEGEGEGEGGGGEGEYSCEGAVKDMADQCLNDKATCQSGIDNSVEMMCSM